MSTPPIEQSLTYQKIRFSPTSSSVREDIVAEVEAVFEVSPERARAITEECLEYYYRREVPPKLVDFAGNHALQHISQPLRIPNMTKRFDRLVEFLPKETAGLSALDYGGGGGKDSILYSRLGYKVTFMDFTSVLTPFVKRRFVTRGLDIEMRDVRTEDPNRYDLINCMDVLEHIYTFEESLADICAHLKVGGLLLTQPSFIYSWNGDHIDKNCGLPPIFPLLMKDLGFELVYDSTARSGGDFFKRTRRVLKEFFQINALYKEPTTTYIYKRVRPFRGEVKEEKKAFTKELYTLTRRYSARYAMLWSIYYAPLFFLGLFFSLIGLRRAHILREFNKNHEQLFNMLLESLSIYRLSDRKLRG